MFAASCDSVEDNTKFAKKLELDYPILSDPSKTVATAQGVVDEDRPFPRRWTVFISKDGKVAHIEKKVDFKNHGKQVAKKLAELKVEKATADKKSSDDKKKKEEK